MPVNSIVPTALPTALPTAPTPVPTTVPDPTLKYYFKFNAGDIDSRGNVANWASGRAVFDGATVLRGPVLTTSYSAVGAGSLDFGANSASVGPSCPGLWLPPQIITSAGFSVAVWGRMINALPSRLFDFSNGQSNGLGGNHDLFFYPINGYVDYYAISGSNSASGYANVMVGPIPAADGSWRHYVLTFDGSSTFKFYYNGALYRSGTFSMPINIIRVSNVFGLSNWNSDGCYQGQMDDIQYYTAPITAAQVSALYALKGSA
jgi:hypothetical protein